MSFSKRSNSLFGISVLAIIITAALSAAAQTRSPSPVASPSPTTSLEHDFFKNILRDQKAIWTAPFHLQQKDARWAVPFVVGTGALMTTDRRTGDEIGKFHAQLNASRIISYAGSTYGVGAVAGMFYLIGRTTHNERARETGILSAESLADSLIVVNALKGISQRARPLSGRERSEFFEGGTSFPSGHAIQAWSVATVIAHEYHDRPAVEIAAYAIASAVSVSRFTVRKHYLSDVLVGSAMGYGIGRYVYRAHHRTKSTGGGNQEEASSETNSKRSLFVTPIYSRMAHAYGASATWSF